MSDNIQFSTICPIHMRLDNFCKSTQKKCSIVIHFDFLSFLSRISSAVYSKCRRESKSHAMASTHSSIHTPAIIGNCFVIGNYRICFVRAKCILAVCMLIHVCLRTREREKRRTKIVVAKSCLLFYHQSKWQPVTTSFRFN